MLLFHGTAVGRDGLRSILRDGLRASPKDWLEHLVPGKSDVVFLSTSPVAGKGGDPIDFARGWPYRTRRSAAHARAAGHLVVVDLPEPSPVPILGAARNIDVEAYWRARAFASIAGGCAEALEGDKRVFTRLPALGVLRQVFAIASARRARIATLLRPRALFLAPGLVAGEVRPHELSLFAKAYTDLPDRRQKAALARRAGVTIPAEFVDDGHYPHCLLCFGSHLFTGGYSFDGGPQVARGDFVLPAQSMGELLDPETMAMFLEALRVWLDAYPAVEVDRVLARDPSLRELARALPPPRDRVPAVLRPDFLTDHDPALFGEVDVQVMTRSIPAAHVLGAIRVTEGHRLRSELRPAPGETLSGNLWRAIHELRRSYRGTPLLR
ncbi:MAG: hypothetical protein U0359_14015 [Byssovorax sp.]